MTDFIDLAKINHFYGVQQALRDVNLQLAPGRIGLLGPNGAGKSTLMKIMLGLLTPQSGSGRVFGHDIRRHSPTLRRLIGYMPEADALIPAMHGVQFVALAGELYGMPRRQAIRRAHEVLTYLDLQDARYRRVEEYSMGMKQRVKLAQALVHDPPALLLDEPTSGLDPAGREGMLQLLANLGRDYGKSILLSTHLLGDVESVCDRVVILYQGRVLCHGAVAELCRRRHDHYWLQVQGEAASFVKELETEGIRVLQNDGKGELRVAAPTGWVTRGFFQLADNHGVVVRGLRSDDEDLEELFHRVIEENTQ